MFRNILCYQVICSCQDWVHTLVQLPRSEHKDDSCFTLILRLSLIRNPPPKKKKHNITPFFPSSSSLQGLTKPWFVSQWEMAGVSPWMNYCIVQEQSGRPLWGSVCKVILQSLEWCTDALTHHRHDTGLHPCCGCSEREKKNIIFTFTGSEEVHSWRPSVCPRSLEKGRVT